jgi:DNA sulfur modification protein DndC
MKAEWNNIGVARRAGDALRSQMQSLIARGALFVINHSGGKDSQAMYLHLREIVPASQRVLVHADLGAVEWAGAVDHIARTTEGERIHTCRARRNLLEMVAERGMFPSPSQRQCTSDLKRGPIERTIRALVENRVAAFLGLETSAETRRKANKRGRAAAIDAGAGLIVNCMGLRAEESTKRKKMVPFKFNKANSKAGREWYDYLPIHSWTEHAVYQRIALAGQSPHIIYSLGMKRFSCVFCMMAPEEQLRLAARLARERPELLNDPDLYRKYVALERSTGQVMLMPSKKHGRRSLEQVTGVPA